MTAVSQEVEGVRTVAQRMPDRTSTMLVLAKAPRPGRVKTRLQTRFSPEQAAALARAALLDTLDAVQAYDAERKVLVLEGEPGPWAPLGFEVMPQGGGDLSERIAAAFEGVVPGDGPALLVGMDTPQLTTALLDVDWTDVDAVLGLCEDGGYWAIGLREPHPRAVRGVPMSRSDTGAQPARPAARAGPAGGPVADRSAMWTLRPMLLPWPR